MLGTLGRLAIWLTPLALFACGRGGGGGAKPPVKPPPKVSKRAVSFAKQARLVVPSGFELRLAVDVNGDSRVDLFGATRDAQYDYKLRLLLQTPGGLVEASHLLPGSYVVWPLTRMIAGDVDGDGDQDVLIGHTRSGKGRLLLNNGQGKFSDASSSLPPPLAWPHFTADVALADFNGDGNLDLFQANAHSTFHVRGKGLPDDVLAYGDGKGGFLQRLQRFPGTSTGRCAVADVNGDGRPDVVRGMIGNCETICDPGEAPDVLLATATGGFTRRALTSRGFWCSFVHAADIDGDLDVDILASGYWLALYPETADMRNDGKGNFKRTAFATKQGAIELSADIDRDGDIDVFVRTSRGAGAWWENDGKGKFTKGPNINARHLGLVDIDSDGDPDLIGDEVLYNDGAGRFSSKAPRLTIPRPWHRGQLIDIDRDGRSDLVAAGKFREAMLYWNDGNGSYEAHKFGHGIFALGAADAGDIDGDGDVDVFVRVQTANDVRAIWLEQTQPRRFALRWKSATLKSLEGDIALLDLDGDGDLDVVDSIGSSTRSWRNDSASYVPSASIPGSVAANKFHVIDVNGDGRSDLYLINSQGNDRLWLGSSTGKMLDATSNLPGSITNTTDIASGDLNGDGAVDLVVASSSRTASVRILLNRGKGVFGDASSTFVRGITGSTARVALADLQEDGDLDLVRSSDDRLRFYLNDGSKLVEAKQLEHSFEGAQGYSLLVGDLDGDLDNDIVISGADSQILRNEQRDLAMRTPPRAGRAWTLDFAVNPSVAGTGRFVLPFVGGASRHPALPIPGLGVWSLQTSAIQLPTIVVPATGRASLSLAVPKTLTGAQLSLQAMVIHATGAGRLHFSNALHQRVVK